MVTNFLGADPMARIQQGGCDFVKCGWAKRTGGVETGWAEP